MDWKRKGKRFSKEQRQGMVDLYCEGHSPTAIAKRAKCKRNTVVTALRKAGIYEGGRKKKAPAPPPSEPRTSPKLQDERAYLLWVTKGALNGWVERLVHDMSRGKFT